MNTQKLVIIIGVLILIIIGWWSFGGDSEIADDDLNEEARQEEVLNTNTETKTSNTSSNTSTNVTADPNAIAPVLTGETSTGSTMETNTQVEAGPEIFVRYTNVGFLPKSITVEEGTTVTFTNESTRTMWVASDNHPSHSILPEFDQKEAVTTGGTYSYTFTKAGQWGFHNHTRPQDEGIVFVNVK